MGYGARNNGHNRLPLDLRSGPGPAAPLIGGQQIVQWNPVVTATQIVDSVLPGNPMPIQVAPGAPPIMGQMVVWSDVLAAGLAKMGEAGVAMSAEDEHTLHILEAVAEFQQKCIALAAAAKEIVASRGKAADEALPEPPPWTPKLVDDDEAAP